MSQAQDIVSRALPRNVKLFLVFRIFFNARYYYPIFALLVIVLLMLAPRTPGAWGEPGGYGQSKARKAESPYGSNQASV